MIENDFYIPCIKREAWWNVTKNSKEKDIKYFVYPDEKGVFYPLAYNGRNFFAVYLGQNDLGCGNKSFVFAERNGDEKYVLYSGVNALELLWDREEDHGLRKRGGISVNCDGLASQDKVEIINMVFEGAFDKLRLGESVVE